jgi:hypothetical protein
MGFYLMDSLFMVLLKMALQLMVLMYHGHTGVTADYPNAIYHYHVTNSDPYINKWVLWNSRNSI